MDWEKTRGRLRDVDEPLPVSIWRTLFVANEWNEMQVCVAWIRLFGIGKIMVFGLRKIFSTITGGNFFKC